MSTGAPDWAMGAVLLTLGIFGAKLLYTASSDKVKSIRNTHRRVIMLSWAGMPNGRVHDCQTGSAPAQYWPCHHSRRHEKALKCWESPSSLATILNRAWRLSERDPRYLDDVPIQLPFSGTYICTDVRTVLAFIVCTVAENKSSSWSPRHLSFGTTRVSRERLGPLTFCHIQGQFQERRSRLTKSELERLLDGYPPWYRETFTTHAGTVRLAFPTVSEADISRGGWIAAVGLMDVSVQSQAPLAVYTCPAGSEPERPAFRSNGVVFRSAVARCRDHIANNIQPHFPADVNVAAAVVMLEHLMVEKTGSGIPSPGRFGPRWSDSVPPLPHLSGPDCRFVMKNLNGYQPLDATDVARYGPILLPAMAAVVHGAYEVVQYLKDVGVELRAPPEFGSLDNEVFLKDCVTVLPPAPAKG
ncbi:hypothetical protein RB597_005144 [Gaeumannomyces tritici]